MRIGGTEIPVQTAPHRSRARRGGFTLPDGGEDRSPAGCAQAAPSSATAAITLCQGWTDEDGAVSDRQARQHGQAVLDALAGLQMAQLGGDAHASLAGLATLAANTPSASDPGLEAVMQAIAARAAIELSRRQ